MTTANKLKLIIPTLYAIAAATFFALTWPVIVESHHVVGVVITVLAFLCWVIARVQLGNAFAIGAKASTLMTRGLYSKLRHPIYYFSILAVVGIGIYAWSLLMLVPIVLLVVLEVYRIREEEKALAKKFGTDYARYKEQTWF